MKHSDCSLMLQGNIETPDRELRSLIRLIYEPRRAIVDPPHQVNHLCMFRYRLHLRANQLNSSLESFQKLSPTPKNRH